MKSAKIINFAVFVVVVIIASTSSKPAVPGVSINGRHNLPLSDRDLELYRNTEKILNLLKPEDPCPCCKLNFDEEDYDDFYDTQDYLDYGTYRTCRYYLKPTVCDKWRPRYPFDILGLFIDSIVHLSYNCTEILHS